MLREIPLEPKRVQSVFKDRPIDAVKSAQEVPIDEVDLALTEKEKPNVMVQVEGSDESNTYFEQFNTICSGVVKTGDFVYVATESGKQAIAQIHSIWETKDGKSFFRGPWLLAPSELPASLLINRMQYRQEVFLSTVQELTPTVGILGRCCVMEYYDYTTRRPTEIPESDVYLCESIYDEFKKQIRKFSSPIGLKKFTHSTGVTADEIYFFRRPINVQKVMADSQDVKSEIVSNNNQN
jgi:protein polybromo-1